MALSRQRNASVAVVSAQLLDWSFELAIRGGVHRFATADSSAEASAEPLPNWFPDTDVPDHTSERETRLNQRLARSAGRTGVLDRHLTHCLRIVALFPSPVNFLSDRWRSPP